MGLQTPASKSRALAVDFNVMSHKASVFLVSRWSCVIASTCPANSHATSTRPRAKDSSSSSDAVEFHSVASVHRGKSLSLKRECSVVPLRPIMSRVARLGVVNLKLNVFKGLACFVPTSLIIGTMLVLSRTPSPSHSLTIFRRVEDPRCGHSGVFVVSREEEPEVWVSHSFETSHSTKCASKRMRQ